jgi:hypothetical protein
VLRIVGTWIFIGALLILFKPLIVGLARAAILVVRPRLTREQRAAKAHMRDQRMMQKMIASSSGPSHAAELRALASRT